MSRYQIIMRSTADRERALRFVQAAPFGSRVEVKAAKRSIPQNSKLWAMLTEVATQLPWHGKKLRPDDWKLLFLDALQRAHKAEVQILPNLDDNGFVNVSTSSSDLSKSEMGDLIELIFEFGARHGVKFQDDAEAA
jgi:hypothetical protein